MNDKLKNKLSLINSFQNEYLELDNKIKNKKFKLNDNDKLKIETLDNLKNSENKKYNKIKYCTLIKESQAKNANVVNCNNSMPIKVIIKISIESLEE